jgi:hypothetical protein
LRGLLGPAPVRRDLDQEFFAMACAFASTGGIVGAGVVGRLMAPHCERPCSALARQIASDKLICIEWRDCTLLPLFQFDSRTMTLRGVVGRVVGELGSVFERWELAMWFARPNTWLGDRAPVECLDSLDQAVHCAARADRYVVTG